VSFIGFIALAVPGGLAIRLNGGNLTSGVLHASTDAIDHGELKNAVAISKSHDFAGAGNTVCVTPCPGTDAPSLSGVHFKAPIEQFRHIG